MTDVSRETLSLNRNQLNAMSDDWAEAEIDILMREDLRPKEMAVRLPHRTRMAIYVKRHRLGVAQRGR